MTQTSKVKMGIFKFGWNKLEYELKVNIKFAEVV